MCVRTISGACVRVCLLFVIAMVGGWVGLGFEASRASLRCAPQVLNIPKELIFSVFFCK